MRKGVRRAGGRETQAGRCSILKTTIYLYFRGHKIRVKTTTTTTKTKNESQKKKNSNYKKLKSKIKLSVCVTFFYNPIYIRKKR